jgi:uncharacterized damage-inducible protein DinB
MTLQQLITNQAGYNLWANQQLVNWLNKKPVELLNQEVPSSFSSILKTVNHIWAIEEYWYAQITKETTFENRYGVEDLQADEIFSGLINRSAILADTIASYTDDELQEKIKIVSPWFVSDNSRAEYLLNLINHGTYHRGQVVTIARNTGITDPPPTGLIFYEGA